MLHAFLKLLQLLFLFLSGFQPSQPLLFYLLRTLCLFIQGFFAEPPEDGLTRVFGIVRNMQFRKFLGELEVSNEGSGRDDVLLAAGFNEISHGDQQLTQV